MERGDFEVMHEPFSPLYYVLEAKGTATAEVSFKAEEISYPKIKTRVLDQAEKGLVFLKDMPYHAFDHLENDPEFLGRIKHSFLIREPAETLASHYAMNPNFTLEEAGYERQYQFFELLRKMGEEPVVIDAGQITSDVESAIQTYCSKMGIPFITEALNWEKKTPKEWNTWDKWHQDASQSQGIVKKKKQYANTIENTPRLQELHAQCLPHYQYLKQFALPL